MKRFIIFLSSKKIILHSMLIFSLSLIFFQNCAKVEFTTLSSVSKLQDDLASGDCNSETHTLVDGSCVEKPAIVCGDAIQVVSFAFPVSGLCASPNIENLLFDLKDTTASDGTFNWQCKRADGTGIAVTCSTNRSAENTPTCNAPVGPILNLNSSNSLCVNSNISNFSSNANDFSWSCGVLPCSVGKPAIECGSAAISSHAGYPMSGLCKSPNIDNGTVGRDSIGTDGSFNWQCKRPDETGVPVSCSASKSSTPTPACNAPTGPVPSLSSSNSLCVNSNISNFLSNANDFSWSCGVLPCSVGKPAIECGPAATAAQADYPASGLCKSPNVENGSTGRDNTAADGFYNWQCKRSDGTGTPVSCQTAKQQPMGSCNESYNFDTFSDLNSSMPLCSTGSVELLSESDTSFRWKCRITGSTATADCQAFKPELACGSAATSSGSVSFPTGAELCTSGNIEDTSYAARDAIGADSEFNWSCKRARSDSARFNCSSVKQLAQCDWPRDKKYTWTENGQTCTAWNNLTENGVVTSLPEGQNFTVRDSTIDYFAGNFGHPDNHATFVNNRPLRSHPIFGVAGPGKSVYDETPTTKGSITFTCQANGTLLETHRGCSVATSPIHCRNQFETVYNSGGGNRNYSPTAKVCTAGTIPSQAQLDYLADGTEGDLPLHYYNSTTGESVPAGTARFRCVKGTRIELSNNCNY